MCGHPGANNSFSHLRLLSTLWRTPAALRPMHQWQTPTGEPELAPELLCNRSRTTSTPGGVWSSRSFIQFRLVLLFALLIPDRNADRNSKAMIKQNILHYLRDFNPTLCCRHCLLPPKGSARATQHILELPAELRSSPDVSLALSINRAFLERNPVRLLRLAKRLTLLETCALHRHLVACRRDLLLVYSHGFSSRNCRFPHGRLAELLDLDTSLTVQICEAHGQEVDKENQVVFSKAKFAEPEQDKLHCKLYHIAEAKKNQDVSIRSIIHGCAEDF